MSWKEAVEIKCKERESRLPPKWLIPSDQLPSSDALNVQNLPRTLGWLSDREIEITEAGIPTILSEIANRQWTSREVTEAFAHRTTIAHQLLNPITEVNFEAAFAQADDLDEYLAREGKTIGPLHGLPISCKDSCDVEGLDTTMGYSAWVGSKAKKDCVMIASLRAAGAIPFVKTNLGHTLMMGESVNHLFGRSLNPWNRSLTPGGSSGGEAALLAFRGSPVGWGTDIGGSIRLPSASTNLYGLRPSPGRVSYRGLADTFLGQEAVRCVLGPMGQSPHDLELLMSVYMASKPWNKDPDVIPLEWKKPSDALADRPCCFAYINGDELVTPHPPIQRALNHVIDKLRKAGHHVVEWQGPLAKEAARLMLDFWTADGGEEIRRRVAASGEPMIPEVAQLLRMTPSSNFIPPTVSQTWKNQHERDLYARQFLDHWQDSACWSGCGETIDGLIIPAAPFLARPHGADLPNSKWGVFEHTYANFQPLFQLSTGSFPSGLFQDPSIDLPLREFIPRSDLDKVVQALYSDPEEWRGAPIGFQLVGRRLEEEKVLAMLQRVKEALE
ncbi:amidase [Cryptococcus gattii Ru294]|nr:amidase [Cryptococcus gattii Ru294]